MSNQIVLQWSVDVAETTFSPAQAAVALGAVVLYQDPATDPVLGQGFGLTVASDVTSATGSGAQRVLTLNMNASAGAPLAPSPFPCHPTQRTPPALPYKFERTAPCPGGFTAKNGQAVVATEFGQRPTLNPGDTIQFVSQLGVDYTVASVGASNGIVLTAPYAGNFSNTTALKVLPAAATLPAIYSTSPLDTSFNGRGAGAVTISYTDSLGASATVTTALLGKRPSPIVLDGGTIDIAVVTDMHISTVGGFGNSLGQITLVDLSAPINNTSPADADTDDQAQLKIDRSLVYLPISYFSFAQQGAATPALAGDFAANPDSTNVFPTVDQTSALSAGNIMSFASDPDVDYTVATVTPKIITLTENYGGLTPVVTAASIVSPSTAAPPTDAALKAPLSQYVNPGNAVPPPGAPLPPQAMTPAPIFLSDFFTQTISFTLAMPVTPAVIALA